MLCIVKFDILIAKLKPLIMKTTNYNNYNQQILIAQETQLFMEKHERNHLEQNYRSVKEPLMCFSKESNYLDSEFCGALEKQGHGDFLL